MKKLVYCLLACLLAVSCSNNDYLQGKENKQQNENALSLRERVGKTALALARSIKRTESQTRASMDGFEVANVSPIFTPTRNAGGASLYTVEMTDSTGVVIVSAAHGKII